MEKNYTNEDIISFVNGTMDDAERVAFAEQMAVDTTLKEEVTFFQSLSSTIQVEKVMTEAVTELKDSGFFSQMEAEEKVTLSEQTTSKAEPKVVHFQKRRWLAYAAAIGLLVVALGGLWWANTQYSNTALASLNAEELQLNISGNQKGTNEIVNNFEKGEVALEQKNYSEAIRFFESITSSDEKYSNALLYLAYAQLQAGQTEKAIQSATNLKSVSNDSKKLHQAEWVMVKANIKGRADNATVTELLDTIIANPNHSFFQEAKVLKRQLESGWRSFVF